MAEDSKIEWTDHTFNPWIGCSKVHEGCKFCYAEADFDQRRHIANWGPNGTRVVTSDKNWKEPIRWNQRAEKNKVRERVFCASLADVFEDWRGPVFDNHGETVGTGLDDYRKRLFELIDKTPHLDWLLLTKRPENISAMVPDNPHSLTEARKNLWLGTSVSDQESFDNQVPELCACRHLSHVLFLSMEPLLGLVDISEAVDSFVRVDWVIIGGESGKNARPMHHVWAGDVIDKCLEFKVPVFFKQWGEWKEVGEGLYETRVIDRHGRVSDGRCFVRYGKHLSGRIIDGQTFEQLPGSYGVLT